MTLAKYPIDKLATGIEVLSANKQVRGQIVEVRKNIRDPERPIVVIKWDNGMESQQPIDALDKVTVAAD